MKLPFEVVAYGILLIFLGFIAFMPIKSNDLVKSKFCKIDSIYTQPKYEFLPEQTTKYRTECGLTFTSNKEYNLGDSIEVKTIIVQ